MKLNLSPIAAALCCMALASSPLVFARGDSTHSMDRSGASSSMSGSHYGSASTMDQQTVRQVQQALSEKGYNPGPIDGMMGPRTRAALQQYQRQNNLAGASGLDRQTLDSLGVHASSSMGASGSMASGSSDSRSSAGSSGARMGGSGGSTVEPSSSSSADQGTASDGAANSRYPTPESRAGSSAGGAGATTGGAGGTSSAEPSSSSSADQGTASDGAANSRYPTPESRGGGSAGSR